MLFFFVNFLFNFQMESQKAKYYFLASLIVLVLYSNNEISKVCGSHSTKTAYLDSFNNEQLQFLNNSDNYKIKKCV